MTPLPDSPRKYATPEQLTVLAPAFYPQTQDPSPVRYLVQSAARCRIPLRLYGQGKPYHDWMQVQVHELLRELESLTTPYVMYVDGSDSVFAADITSILMEYTLLGFPPLLFSVEPDGLNAGGWMGRTQAAITALEMIASLHIAGRMGVFESNPQTRWRWAVRNKLVAVTPDLHRNIFYVMNNGPLNFTDEGEPETLSGAMPCVLHFAGGYTDPKSGKEDQIEPVWEKLWCGGRK